ncbi:MAG: PRC-barrel domain-containing protein [Pyrinomonadaceae bacterium]|nr:PRC-barrel domain-containing protein [Sphingobacteriaceae bacterium]
MNNHNSDHIRLKELGSSKFEVANNESDIRGWKVKNTQGRILGTVNDLLFDTSTEKVLYMVLDMTGNELYLKDRKVLLPLEYADLQVAYQHVVFPGIMANELTELPFYEKGKITTGVEEIVRRAFVNTSKNNLERENPLKSFDEEISERDQWTNRSRPQTVVGVFEFIQQGQEAIAYLLEHDFKRNQIDISSRTLENQSGYPKNDDTSLNNWFKSVFGNDNDAKTYSDAAKAGCVITVHTSEMDNAERAAEILDKHGALKLNDSAESRDRKFHSRILDRKDASLKWDRN